MTERAIQVIDFTTVGNSGDFIGEGWSIPEPQGTWSVGPESKLTIRKPANFGNFVIHFCATPAVSSDGRGPASQRLALLVNGNEIYTGTLTATVEPKVPVADAFLSGDDIIIELRHPDWVIPADVGTSGDVRPLAVWFHSLTLVGEAVEFEGPADEAVATVAAAADSAAEPPPTPAEAPAADVTPADQVSSPAATSQPKRGGWLSFIGW